MKLPWGATQAAAQKTKTKQLEDFKIFNHYTKDANCRPGAVSFPIVPYTEDVGSSQGVMSQMLFPNLCDSIDFIKLLNIYILNYLIAAG